MPIPAHLQAAWSHGGHEPRPTIHRGRRADADIVIAFAIEQLGKPYQLGAAGPDAWDCSGLVSMAYRRIGVVLPHHAESMPYVFGTLARVPRRGDLRPGDIVIPHYGHVGLYLGSGYIIHASNPRQGVRIDKLWGFRTALRVTRPGYR